MKKCLVVLFIIAVTLVGCHSPPAPNIPDVVQPIREQPQPLPVIPETPPTPQETLDILNVEVKYIADTTAEIYFDTSKESKAYVEVNSITRGSDGLTSHRVKIDNLQPNTVYKAKITAYTTIEADKTVEFTTLELNYIPESGFSYGGGYFVPYYPPQPQPIPITFWEASIQIEVK